MARAFRGGGVDKRICRYDLLKGYLKPLKNPFMQTLFLYYVLYAFIDEANIGKFSEGFMICSRQDSSRKAIFRGVPKFSAPRLSLIPD